MTRTVILWKMDRWMKGRSIICFLYIITSSIYLFGAERERIYFPPHSLVHNIIQTTRQDKRMGNQPISVLLLCSYKTKTNYPDEMYIKNIFLYVVLFCIDFLLILFLRFILYNIWMWIKLAIPKKHHHHHYH